MLDAKKACGLEPSCSAHYELVAEIFTKMNRVDKARKYYEKAWALNICNELTNAWGPTEEFCAQLEAERALGTTPRRLRQAEQRAREGTDNGFPPPVLVTRGGATRLWSLSSIREWWMLRSSDNF